MNNISTLQSDQIPSVSLSQITKIDSLAVEKFNTPISTMMDNASNSISNLVKSVTQNNQVLILSGKGNNGGDGIGASIYLIEQNITPTIILAQSESNLSSDSQIKLEIAREKGVSILVFNQENLEEIYQLFKNTDLIIDALLGYNLKGNPRKPYSDLIRLSNDSKKPILSVDLPSGLTPDKGRPSSPTIKANWTLSLGLPKKGLFSKSAKKFAGNIYHTDLGIPQELFNYLSIQYKSNNSQLIKLS